MPSLTWHLSTTLPTAWLEWIRVCHGGVFHTRPGLLVDAPQGTPLYGQLVNASGETVGIALGVRHGCRLATTERHAHFPTLPALAPAIDPLLALDTLKRQLGESGIAEVTIGSYDATYTPQLAEASPPRLEYVVPTPPNAADIPLSTTHRRHVRRGEREGWSTRFLTGAEAEAAILGVQRSTAERAAALARSFVPVQHAPWAQEIVTSAPLPEYGLFVLAAYRDTSLLSSVLVGWAGERAFYLIGGSTAEGYQCGAAVWLHMHVIRILIQHGIQTYNLGGTPMDASLASSPGHGLYRFKTGFGVSPVVRQGVHWVLRPGHLRLHQMLIHLRRVLRRD